ncbi:hypothetical protein FLJC2902T_32310 [Flavobacterium limnosediminis JC2902]|uniref:Uncharacterized protein n=1 Tax=Flavobacterium limnosediminis JC2902 TaxID=1341181 RepID=V6S9Z0_9FLAO|nr:hypothetical protein [Flavobacterium limnosediminis]ESU23067.1 hypothetical protein FLJC2902T_32310 [Flavobacterium limnosediminis JC2902]
MFSQSDFDKVLKAGEVLAAGFSIFKVAKSDPQKDSKDVESLCVKNKLADKITFRITGKDSEDNDVKKEMVIQNDGKECIFNVPKGIYTYEVILPNKDIYKKGEYKLDDDIVITIRKDE